MITEQDINELEERVTRMFPYIDITAVNVIRREVAHLRSLIAKPVPTVETVVVEEKVAVEPTKPKKVRGQLKDTTMLDEDMGIPKDGN